ncbi:TlpA family protein disulfide reductase [Pedobacter punctiformis]|uniref:TlpA disulfide reductase family protein n=1 Tax=Pedobacter punctiformis TaxID=3004097 RepID=A0ABT4L9G7_9SPHI|nr:TlpA disulfide reductase family protein [Pedobacter sp. HCMS5-2]MCZ4244540.1 TlpA disulfide reductase family protein [Pedobacter sp. HCMS5-2]
MKSIKLLLTLLIFAGVAKSQGVKFSADKPAAGTKISFTYEPKGTSLENLADIKCTSYTFFSTTNPKAGKIDLVKEGSIYKGEFSTPDSVTLVGLAFYVGDKKDEAPGGYILKFTKAGKIPAEALINEAFLYGLAGNYYLGLTIDAEAASALYKQAFTLRPALKQKNAYQYLSLEYKADKEKGTKNINENINSLSKIKDAKEDEMTLLLNLYNLLKQKPKADSVKTALLKKYPVGNYAYGQDINALYVEKDLAVKEQKANDLIAKFKFDTQKKTDAARLSSVYSILANASSKEKNNDKFELYSSKIDNKLNRASLYNSFAWPAAEKNENIDAAAKFSKRSLDLLNEAKNDEVPAFYSSKDEYLKALDNSYGMYADTYALLLYRQGKFKEALAVQEKALPFYTKVSPDVATRYVTYLIKDGQQEKAFNEAEKIIKNGEASDSLKTDFKNLYVSLKKEGTYDGYIANLEKIALEKDRAEWTKKMINTPAPAFSLVNLKGETVSLAGLKGKIVVLDYWATWCGPCVASFPGMQKAMAKYANNPNVAFVFVNTWQTEDNREKLVTDFIAEKKYDFNVLYDTKNKQDPSKFDVVSAYKVDGIPTKFVIDGDGNIRFKAVGFSGSDDGVVKEIDSMIGLIASKEGSK